MAPIRVCIDRRNRTCPEPTTEGDESTEPQGGAWGLEAVPSINLLLFVCPERLLRLPLGLSVQGVPKGETYPR